MDWLLKIGIILLCGAVGGIVNAILMDGGFKSAFRQTLSNGQQIYLPGWQGNVFIGAIAALIFWVTYGNMKVVEFEEMLRQGVGAIIAGFAGGKLITQETEKQILNSVKNDLADTLREAIAHSEKR